MASNEARNPSTVVLYGSVAMVIEDKILKRPSSS
jgi:hypothetical protein